jgi:hypothetical protein
VDIKQKLVQDVLLEILDVERGIEPDFSCLGTPLTAADEKYLDMSRDEIADLMSRAFTAGDSFRWRYLGERFLDHCDIVELKVHNLSLSFVGKAFQKINPFTCPDVVGVITEACDRAKAEIDRSATRRKKASAVSKIAAERPQCATA